MRPTLRALLILVLGGVATALLGRPLATLLGDPFGPLGVAVLVTVVIGATYFPLVRLRCPSCERFPFRTERAIGVLPLLYFWPKRKCERCGAKIEV